MYYVRHLAIILFFSILFFSMGYASSTLGHPTSLTSKANKEHNLSDETIATVMMIITQYLINEPSSTTETNTTSGGDTNNTDGNTTSGGDSNSTDGTGGSTTNAINTQLLTKVSTQFNTITNVIAIENNGSIQFSTQFLGKDVNITAFDVGTDGAYAFVTQITAPFYEILTIDNDTWLNDPDSVDRSSPTRKLYLDDLGFSQTKTFIFVSQDLNLTQDNVPTPVKDILTSINANSFNIVCESGLSIHDKIALDDIPEIEETLNFLAFSGGSLGGIIYPESTYNMSTIVTVSLSNLYTPLWQKAVLPTFVFHTPIDNFDLQFGDYVQFTLHGLLDPLTIQPVLNVSRDADGLIVSINDSRVEMPITTLSVNCYLRIYLKTTPIDLGEKRVSITIKNNEDWPIFGAKWLSFAPDSYGLHLQVPQTDAILNIKHYAQTELLGKYVVYQQTETRYAGSTINRLSPPSQGFVLHDGPGKIGEVPIYWFAQLMEYILQVSGADVDLNLITNIASPLKLKGLLPEGETIENYEKQLGHPIGPQFELFPSPKGIPGVNFDGALTLFDIPKPLATIEKFEFSTTNGIDIKASTTDFTLGDGSLFEMPNFNLVVNVPGLKDLIGTLADAPLNEDLTFGQNVITAIEDSAADIAALYTSIEAKLIGHANVLTADADLEYIIKPYTEKSDFVLAFAGITGETSIYRSLTPWDPGLAYTIKLDTTELSGWANSGSDIMKQQISDLFSNIDTGIADVQQAIDKAQADLDTARSDFNRIRANAQRNKDNIERDLRSAQNAVNDAKNNLKDYDYDNYYTYSTDQICAFGVCLPSPRQVAYPSWKVGRIGYTASLASAEWLLSRAEEGVNQLPVDAYPEVITAKANVVLAEENLAAAEDLAISLRAVSSALNDALTFATNAVDDAFQLLEFKIYGGLGLDSRVGIYADVILFGKHLTLNENVDGDLYYLRDNLISILNQLIWKPLSEMIVDQSISDFAADVYANQGLTPQAPEGTIPTIELLQDNSKECNLSIPCYSFDVSSYISDTDTDVSKLRFSATNLPKHLKMDLHGNVSGALTRDDIGIHTVTVNIQDDTFNTLSVSFDLNISGYNAAHTLKIITAHQYIDSQNFSNTSENALVSSYATIKADALASAYTTLAQVLVDDVDIGDTYTYEIISGNTAGHFDINDQGTIRLTSLAEGNIKDHYHLTIRVTDNSTFSPQNREEEISFDIDVMPIIWLDSNATIKGANPTFTLHVSPTPSAINKSIYTVYYEIIPSTLSTDDENSTIHMYENTVLARKPGAEAFTYQWDSNYSRDLSIANNNRQIDREYTIKLTEVHGDAFLDESRKELKANVYALADMINSRPLSNAVSNFSKLDIDGHLLPESASDWACIKDNATDLIWVSRTRLEQYLPQDMPSWIYKREDRLMPYGYNMVSVTYNTSTSYCGKNNINLPTTTELQSLLDYSQPQEMIESTYFPDINFNKPYMALNIDSFTRNNTHLTNWITLNYRALSEADPTGEGFAIDGYMSNLFNANPNTLFEFPLLDTPVSIVNYIRVFQNELASIFSTINFDTGDIKKASSTYTFDTNYFFSLTPNIDAEILYVLYPENYPSGDNKILNKNENTNNVMELYSQHTFTTGN